VLCALRLSRTTLKKACAPVALFPQMMINVPLKQRKDHARDPRVRAAVQQAESDLGKDGRVLLRPSGTEPVIRVMVEAKSKVKAGRWAKTIADAVSAAH
jgi:phosphoglucosamine mutase